MKKALKAARVPREVPRPPAGPEYSLPAEILGTIFDYLDKYEDKMRARQVNKFWRNAIDSRPEIYFNIDLDNRNLKYVQKLQDRVLSIDKLTVQSLRNPSLDLRGFPKFNSAIIGEGISEGNIWQFLLRCQYADVTKLIFRTNSIPVSFPSSVRRLDLPLLKILKIVVVGVSNADVEISGQMSSASVKEMQQKRFESFLSFLQLLRLGSLKDLRITVDMEHCEAKLDLSVFYNFLIENRHTLRFLTAKIRSNQSEIIVLPSLDELNLEKLLLTFDPKFLASVYPLTVLRGNRLRKLYIKETDFRDNKSPLSCTNKIVSNLVNTHCATLTSLTLKMYLIDCIPLKLQNCVALTYLDFQCEMFGNLPGTLQLPTLRSLGFSSKFWAGTFTSEIFLQWLNVAKDLREITFHNSTRFFLSHLDYILGHSETIQKIILKNTDFDRRSKLFRFCRAKRGLKGFWLDENGEFDPSGPFPGSDFCITINRDLFRTNAN